MMARLSWTMGRQDVMEDWMLLGGQSVKGPAVASYCQDYQPPEPVKEEPAKKGKKRKKKARSPQFLWDGLGHTLLQREYISHDIYNIIYIHIYI